MAAETRNPVFTRAAFGARAAVTGETMTLAGVMGKSLLLLAICFAGMLYVWEGMPGIGLSGAVVNRLFIGGFIGGVGLLLYTRGRPERAIFTGPLYAILQGLVIGALTIVLQARYRGLPVQAALLTVTTLVAMLIGYRTGLIRASEKFRTIVSSCTLSVFLFYIITFAVSFLGVDIPFLHEGGLLGIGFSLFVVVLASLNLILDFDFIERGIGSAPAAYEWVAAFGLVVTLIWLYMEMLRLLTKLRR
jgi:uncharacterized YccA/Bax inhibitor family protein